MASFNLLGHCGGSGGRSDGDWDLEIFKICRENVVTYVSQAYSPVQIYAQTLYNRLEDIQMPPPPPEIVAEVWGLEMENG
jgi:hypothetical protein